MNTASTPRGLNPSVRRIAMSVRLSLTTITRVATMLNTATATISMRINPIMVFSILIARKYASFSCVQSRSSSPGGQARCGGARQFGRPQHVVELQADAGRTRQTAKRLRILEVDEGQHAVVLLQPDLEEPHHLEFLQPRHDGAARSRRPES